VNFSQGRDDLVFHRRLYPFTKSRSRASFSLAALFLISVAALASVAGAVTAGARPQQVANITITGGKKLRMAVPQFAVQSTDPSAGALEKTFHDVLFNDLYQSGLLEMVSQSFYPSQAPTTAQDATAQLLATWAAPPVSVERLTFGSLRVANGELQVDGYLYDTTPQASPAYLLGKRYTDTATDESARIIAHELANAIVERLGGGTGIYLSRIYFISKRSGDLEVWAMDYDGANQQQITHLHSITYSPRVSPDGSRLAFMTYANGTPQIRIYSLLAHRYLPFPKFKGLNATPAWAPDGSKLAFASSMAGDTNIYTINADGTGLRRLTYSRGVDIAPVWNPTTGAQIAFVSDRTGLPQIYMMDADGANQRRITTGGYAVSPSWSPNGQALAFSWRRTGGGEYSGMYDVYVLDLASNQYEQLTHNNDRNDFPTWAPDGRHLALQTGPDEAPQIFTILADGSNPAQLTNGGTNEMPFWSAH
jgi:TolB protein